jgi:ATP-dependent Clp protease adaptor protein ClpS
MDITQNKTDVFNQDELDVLTTTDESCTLIVWNDEVNTFEWVIETLME